MSRTVFILGAGASAEAGAPCMKDFFDRAELLLRTKRFEENERAFIDTFKAIAELNQVYAKAYLDTDNIEDVFSAFEMSKLLGKLGDFKHQNIYKLCKDMKVIISDTLEKTMAYEIRSDPNGPHDDLLRMQNIEEGLLNPIPIASWAHGAFAGIVKQLEVEEPGRICIITFNYDLAIEATFRQYSDIKYSYCLDEKYYERIIPFLKLHGSINWGRCNKCKKISSNQEWKYKMKNANWGYIYGVPSRIRCCKDGVIHSVPEVVPPTWNKTNPTSSVKNVWKRAAVELKNAEEIIIVGYSLPETDLFFKYLYALGTVSNTRIKRLIVCNPDESVESRFRKLIGKGIEGRFEFYKLTFNAFMKLYLGQKDMMPLYPKFKKL